MVLEPEGPGIYRGEVEQEGHNGCVESGRTQKGDGLRPGGRLQQRLRQGTLRIRRVPSRCRCQVCIIADVAGAQSIGPGAG